MYAVLILCYFYLFPAIDYKDQNSSWECRMCLGIVVNVIEVLWESWGFRDQGWADLKEKLRVMKVIYIAIVHACVLVLLVLLHLIIKIKTHMLMLCECRMCLEVAVIKLLNCVEKTGLYRLIIPVQLQSVSGLDCLRGKITSRTAVVEPMTVFKKYFYWC